MNPNPATQDEDVVFEVQKWFEEERELIALGHQEVPPGYKIAALKNIATLSSWLVLLFGGSWWWFVSTSLLAGDVVWCWFFVSSASFSHDICPHRAVWYLRRYVHDPRHFFEGI